MTPGHVTHPFDVAAEAHRRWTAELAETTPPAPDFADGAIHHLDVNADAAAERRYDEILQQVLAVRADRVTAEDGVTW